MKVFTTGPMSSRSASPGCCRRSGRPEPGSPDEPACQTASVLRAVILDLDGTLVDHHGAVMEAVSAVSTVDRGATDVDALRQTWWELERRHMDEYLAGACTFAEQRRRLRTFLPLLGQPVPTDPHQLDAWFAKHFLGGGSPNCRRR